MHDAEEVWSRRIPTYTKSAEEPILLDYKQTGMGPIGPGPEQEFLLHSALALTTDGGPLGLVGQIAWARDPETRGKGAARKQLPIEEKESYRWLKIQEQIAARVPDGTQTVLMGDRESDIYDLFIAPRQPQQELLVRGA